MCARLARDDEVATWQDQGWILVEGLVGTDEIDAATADLDKMFPTPERFHADPAGETEKWLGRPPMRSTDEYVWPPTGPGFRPEQHKFRGEFPFPGAGLNRLCVHPSLVDFAERALATTDIRIYQTGMGAKYTGVTNYEQPMHADRNHSWVPARTDPPWWHMEAFLYLSDVDDGTAPTHLVSVHDSVGRATTAPLYFPKQDPELYAAERPAIGARGSLLAYRPDVFHRAVDLTKPGGSRFLLNASYKVAGHEWIGFHASQSNASSPHWVEFVEGSTVRELVLFGFPPPGHPIWNETLLDSTAVRYPKLDLTPWREAFAGPA